MNCDNGQRFHLPFEIGNLFPISRVSRQYGVISSLTSAPLTLKPVDFTDSNARQERERTLTDRLHALVCMSHRQCVQIENLCSIDRMEPQMKSLQTWIVVSSLKRNHRSVCFACMEQDSSLTWIYSGGPLVSVLDDLDKNDDAKSST